jgi:hypothetical protein
VLCEIGWGSAAISNTILLVNTITRTSTLFPKLPDRARLHSPAHCNTHNNSPAMPIWAFRAIPDPEHVLYYTRRDTAFHNTSFGLLDAEIALLRIGSTSNIRTSAGRNQCCELLESLMMEWRYQGMPSARPGSGVTRNLPRWVSWSRSDIWNGKYLHAMVDCAISTAHAQSRRIAHLPHVRQRS